MSFPIEAIAQLPLPGMAHPGEMRFSPDGRLVSYLFSPQATLTRQLYAFDPESGRERLLVEPPGGGLTESNVSLEEALRRERLRQREVGVTQYAWGANNRLLIPAQGSLYVADAPGGELRCIATADPAACEDAQLSPDGAWVAYVQQGSLWVTSFAGGEAQQVAAPSAPGLTVGLAEYIAQEEMGRRTGFWWSPDSRRLAFVEVDETHIPVYRILHQGKALTGAAAQEDHHYPFAGQANACVRLGVVERDGGEPLWLDLGEESDIYLARVHWLPDGRLMAEILERAQTRLDLVVFDLAAHTRQVVLTETSPVWINLHDVFYALTQTLDQHHNGFIWASERDGWRNLYLVTDDGRSVRPLTQGPWMVDVLHAVDEQKGLVYFSGHNGDARQRQLYAVSLHGGPARQVTQAPGTHDVVLDPACTRFVDTHHSLHQPPQITLRRLADDAVLAHLYRNDDARIAALGLKPPQAIAFPNRRGDILYGLVYQPPAECGPGPYPTLVDVYGGPQVQRAGDEWAWTVALRRQYLANLGFVVLVVDNRASARRGLAFEGVIRHDLGHYEVEDQLDGVAWLAAQGLADPARVGVYGWSYGGYLALMCLARAPEVFRAGVAGAPVTHWDGYDTHYTERYMGTPQSNPQGYENSSVMAHVQSLRGKLLLVHGLIDENVHFRHTARLINALIAARKPYELFLFPDERHMPRKQADRIYMEERMRDFFVEAL